MNAENRTPDTTPVVTPVDTAAGSTPGRLPRGRVWVLLFFAVAINIGASLFSLPIAVGLVSGVAVLGLGALLVRDHYEQRFQREA